MTQSDDVLFRASQFLRSESEPGWDAIADRVINAVRRTPRSPGWPLTAEKPADWAGPGELFVNDEVLRGAIAIALRQRYLCTPGAIEFDVNDGRLHGVHVEVTASYGTDLYGLASAIRGTIAELVEDVIGARDGSRPIDITVTDVVTGDPLDG